MTDKKGRRKRRPSLFVRLTPVDGYQMIIVVGEDRYDYRGRGPGDFKLCPSFVPQPLPEESVPGIRY